MPFHLGYSYVLHVSGSILPYVKNQIDVSILCVCTVIANEFCQVSVDPYVLL